MTKKAMCWECTDCGKSDPCRLYGWRYDDDDPPQGCPWAHNNPDDPNRVGWKEVR